MITLVVVACLTILNSAAVDLAATQAAVLRYGPASEGNPIARAVGPELYFGAGLVWYAGTCREQDPGWTRYALLFWAVETWAVNTHVAAGTARAGLPLLYFTLGP